MHDASQHSIHRSGMPANGVSFMRRQGVDRGSARTPPRRSRYASRRTGGTALVMLAAMLAGCSSDGATEPVTESRPASSATREAARADPLEGEWRQEFTCDDQVRAFRRGTKELGAEGRAMFEEYVRPMAAGAYWSEDAKLPPRNDVCKYAPASWERILRVQDGQMVWFDPGGVVGTEATYELVDDHTFTASDGDQNIDGTYTFEFRIEGDRLTIDLVDPDPFVGAAVGVAPFERMS